MTDDPLLGCRLKLQQTQRHLWELKAELQTIPSGIDRLESAIGDK
jgi:hypothetical protein